MSPLPNPSIPVTSSQTVELPFVDENNYWHVYPTNSYDADTALGKKFAQKLFEALEEEEHEVALNLLDWIVESQIKHATHADKNLRTAFWYQITLVLRNGVIYTRKESERKRLEGGQ